MLPCARWKSPRLPLSTSISKGYLPEFLLPAFSTKILPDDRLASRATCRRSLIRTSTRSSGRSSAVDISRDDVITDRSTLRKRQTTSLQQLHSPRYEAKSTRARVSNDIGRVGLAMSKPRRERRILPKPRHPRSRTKVWANIVKHKFTSTSASQTPNITSSIRRSSKISPQRSKIGKIRGRQRTGTLRSGKFHSSTYKPFSSPKRKRAPSSTKALIRLPIQYDLSRLAQYVQETEHVLFETEEMFERADVRTPHQKADLLVQNATSTQHFELVLQVARAYLARIKLQQDEYSRKNPFATPDDTGDGISRAQNSLSDSTKDAELSNLTEIHGSSNQFQFVICLLKSLLVHAARNPNSDNLKLVSAIRAIFTSMYRFELIPRSMSEYVKEFRDSAGLARSSLSVFPSEWLDLEKTPEPQLPHPMLRREESNDGRGRGKSFTPGAGQSSFVEETNYGAYLKVQSQQLLMYTEFFLWLCVKTLNFGHGSLLVSQVLKCERWAIVPMKEISTFFQDRQKDSQTEPDDERRRSTLVPISRNLMISKRNRRINAEVVDALAAGLIEGLQPLPLSAHFRSNLKLKQFLRLSQLLQRHKCRLGLETVKRLTTKVSDLSFVAPDLHLEGLYDLYLATKFVGAARNQLEKTIRIVFSRSLVRAVDIGDARRAIQSLVLLTCQTVKLNSPEVKEALASLRRRSLLNAEAILLKILESDRKPLHAFDRRTYCGLFMLLLDSGLSKLAFFMLVKTDGQTKFSPKVVVPISQSRPLALNYAVATNNIELFGFLMQSPEVKGNILSEHQVLSSACHFEKWTEIPRFMWTKMMRRQDSPRTPTDRTWQADLAVDVAVQILRTIARTLHTKKRQDLDFAQDALRHNASFGEAKKFLTSLLDRQFGLPSLLLTRTLTESFSVDEFRAAQLLKLRYLMQLLSSASPILAELCPKLPPVPDTIPRLHRRLLQYFPTSSLNTLVHAISVAHSPQRAQAFVDEWYVELKNLKDTHVPVPRKVPRPKLLQVPSERTVDPINKFRQPPYSPFYGDDPAEPTHQQSIQPMDNIMIEDKAEVENNDKDPKEDEDAYEDSEDDPFSDASIFQTPLTDLDAPDSFYETDRSANTDGFSATHARDTARQLTLTRPSPSTPLAPKLHRNYPKTAPVGAATINVATVDVVLSRVPPRWSTHFDPRVHKPLENWAYRTYRRLGLDQTTAWEYTRGRLPGWRNRLGWEPRVEEAQESPKTRESERRWFLERYGQAWWEVRDKKEEGRRSARDEVGHTGAGIQKLREALSQEMGKVDK